MPACLGRDLDAKRFLAPKKDGVVNQMFEKLASLHRHQGRQLECDRRGRCRAEIRLIEGAMVVILAQLGASPERWLGPCRGRSASVVEPCLINSKAGRDNYPVSAVTRSGLRENLDRDGGISVLPPRCEEWTTASKGFHNS